MNLKFQQSKPQKKNLNKVRAMLQGHFKIQAGNLCYNESEIYSQGGLQINIFQNKQSIISTAL
jgi:hypothetical protein